MRQAATWKDVKILSWHFKSQERCHEGTDTRKAAHFDLYFRRTGSTGRPLTKAPDENFNSTLCCLHVPSGAIAKSGNLQSKLLLLSSVTFSQTGLVQSERRCRMDIWGCKLEQ